MTLLLEDYEVEGQHNSVKTEKTIDMTSFYERDKLMREKILERKLAQAVNAMGGICPKFVSPGFDGMPDRILLLPGGRIAFVEVKAPGRKARPLQLVRHAMLRRLGFTVFVLDRMELIDKILEEVMPREVHTP